MRLIKIRNIVMGLLALYLSWPVYAWDMLGEKEIALHTNDGKSISIGTVTFTTHEEKTVFSLHLDYAKFKDFFLSMKEFKCLEGPNEVQCHVPYPYPNPATVSRTDLRWLEHSLLFVYKLPKDFGMNLWNGIYYRLELTEQGIVGTPQAIDLNLIASPAVGPLRPPYGPMERNDMTPGSRWISTISIR